MSDSELLTPLEAATALGVRAREIYALIDRGELALVRSTDGQPGLVRVRSDEVAAMVRRRQLDSGGESG